MDRSLLQADLNLLKVFLVLLEERNVTHAAERLFVSQPAISKSLRRLRELFGDPLFVRSPSGLIATTRAEDLEAPVRHAIESLGYLLKSGPFDPLQASGTIRIAAPEPFVVGTIPKLAVEMLSVAPGLSLEVRHLDDDYLTRLAAGELDFVIYLDKRYPEGYVARPLLKAVPRIWFRDQHPLAKRKSIALEDTCAYPQVAFRSPNVAAEDISFVENAMKQQRLTRKVIMNTSHLLVALDVLMKTDALMLGPDYLSRLPAFSMGIGSHSVSSVPAFRRMNINLVLVQHIRTGNSSLHRWLAEHIVRAFFTDEAPRARNVQIISSSV